MKKVSIKVAQALVTMVPEITSAFKEVIINYGDESVSAFTQKVKELRTLNKDAASAVLGVDIAVGLVNMIATNEGSFINRAPKVITEQLEAIVSVYANTSEDLVDVSSHWLAIAANIMIVPPSSISTTEIIVGGEDVNEGTEIIVENDDEPVFGFESEDQPIYTGETPDLEEEQKILEEAMGEFAQTLSTVTNEMMHEAEALVKAHAAEKKEKESTLATDILIGAGVVVGTVVVGVGLYYAYQGIFGNDKLSEAR